MQDCLYWAIKARNANSVKSILENRKLCLSCIIKLLPIALLSANAALQNDLKIYKMDYICNKLFGDAFLDTLIESDRRIINLINDAISNIKSYEKDIENEILYNQLNEMNRYIHNISQQVNRISEMEKKQDKEMIESQNLRKRLQVVNSGTQAILEKVKRIPATGVDEFTKF